MVCILFVNSTSAFCGHTDYPHKNHAKTGKAEILRIKKFTAHKKYFLRIYVTFPRKMTKDESSTRMHFSRPSQHQISKIKLKPFQ